MGTKRTTSRHLPMDVARIILSRLPSKSLLRFRCVSKSWRDLINDSKFIEFHRNQNNNDHIFTLSLQTHCNRTRSVFSLSKTLMEHPRVYLPFPKFCHSSRQCVIVKGCSNGLVLLCISNYGMHFSKTILWNPSIRKHKVLLFPNSNIAFPHIIGFGFVPRINDYKVLNFVYRSNGDGYHVEIYSLSTNSWKGIEDVVGCIVTDGQLNRVVNGVIHFMAFDTDTKSKFILRFDMADEVFTKINIPQLSQYLMMSMIPMMFGEELVLLVMDKYDGAAAAEESWIKVFTTNKLIEPLGYLKNDKLVCRYRREHERGRLCLFHPRLRTVMDVANSGDFPLTIHSLFPYTENLILLNEGDSDQNYLIKESY